MHEVSLSDLISLSDACVFRCIGVVSLENDTWQFDTIDALTVDTRCVLVPLTDACVFRCIVVVPLENDTCYFRVMPGYCFSSYLILILGYCLVLLGVILRVRVGLASA